MKKNKEEANVSLTDAYFFPFTVRGKISPCSVHFAPESLGKTQQHTVAFHGVVVHVYCVIKITKKKNWSAVMDKRLHQSLYLCIFLFIHQFK